MYFSSYPPLSPPPPMPDLLSSILCGQDLLFTPSSQVTIQRNGNLEVKNQQKLESSCSNKQTSFEKPSADVAKELLGMFGIVTIKKKRKKRSASK